MNNQFGNKDENFVGAERQGKNLPQYGKKGHKPRKPYTRSEANLDEITTNKIEYWNNTEAFNNVVKFNWDLIVGNPRNASFVYKRNDGGAVEGDINPPQIMFIDYVTGPGWAESVQDGVNRGLNMLMSRIRSTLSTSNLGFETADLGIFISATSSIAQIIGHAKKLLESYTLWKDRNYVYPRAILHGCGYDYADIRDNINVYTARLNALIDMYNNMSIPDIFQIYDRQYAIAHNVFSDEISDLAQLYVFNPYNYYVYDDQNAKAVSKDLSRSFPNFGSLLDVIDEQIQSWYSSSDLYQINGTILRAFKDAPRQSIPYHQIENKIDPVVDRAFLMQIMNMTILGLPVLSSLDITQDLETQNFVIWKPEFMKSNSALVVMNNDYTVLRLFENDVTGDDNMELTRFTNFLTPKEGGENLFLARNCGSELVVSIRSAQYSSISDSFTSEFHLRSNAIRLNTTDNASMSNAMHNLVAWQPFRYIPCIAVTWIDHGNNKDLYLGMLGDVYNWMLYPKSDWIRLQEVAYQSIWKPINI